MRKALFLLVILNILTFAYAENEVSKKIAVDFAWYPSNHDGYETTGFAPIDFSTVPKEDLTLEPGDEGRDLGGHGYEGIVKYIYSVKTPFMQGSGALTRGNNLEVRLQGDASPVSTGASVKTILTPIAFLALDASVYAGTGWSVGGLNGLALNTKENPYDPTPLEGLYFKADGGTTLQFDFAVLKPGDWSHVVAVYRPSFEYQLNSAADSDEPWQWQADPGENYNGWNWLQTFFLGYQTPALKKLNTLGVAVETERRITKQGESKMDDGGWGSDFTKIYIAPVAVLDFGENHQLTIQAQFAKERDFTDETVGNESFLNRAVDTDDPTYWYFRRIALSYSYFL